MRILFIAWVLLLSHHEVGGLPTLGSSNSSVSVSSSVSSLSVKMSSSTSSASVSTSVSQSSPLNTTKEKEEEINLPPAIPEITTVTVQTADEERTTDSAPVEVEKRGKNDGQSAGIWLMGRNTSDNQFYWNIHAKHNAGSTPEISTLTVVALTVTALYLF